MDKKMCTVVHQTGQDCLILRKMLMLLLIMMKLSAHLR